MASTFSNDLKLELITTGEKAGLWGTITNTNLQILQQAASGYLSLGVTITLPASPAVGSEIVIIDARGTFGSNAVTVERNGQPINSGTNNLSLSTNGQAVTLVYIDSTRGWSFKTNTA